MAKPLSNQQIKQLRRIGHALSPVIMLGQHGLTDNVIAETIKCLDNHELIKVKISGEDRELRQSLMQSLLDATGAQLIYSIGKVLLIYKPALKPNPHLSNLVRFAHLQA